MKKGLLTLIFSGCSILFLILVFISSPYRELRPYELFGKKIPEKTGQIAKMVDHRKVILISDTDQPSPFYIDQRPITIGDYKRSTAPDSEFTQHYRYNYTKFFADPIYNIFPVTFVNWMDARNFCLAAGGDLPTDSQWRSAAGASYNFDYPWGNSLPNLARANIDGYYQMLTPSGWLPKGASPYGVLDMTGNVREWMLDELYEENDNKVLKGGGDTDSFSDGKTEAFFDHGPTSSGFNRGFRCVYPAD